MGIERTLWSKPQPLLGSVFVGICLLSLPAAVRTGEWLIGLI